MSDAGTEPFDLPIDTKDPHKPIITIVIISFKPYVYAVTFRAFIDGQNRDIRRWDNVNKPDHMDIFHLRKPERKHLKSSLGKVRKTSDLQKIVIHIFENWRKYVKQYQQ